MRFRWLFLVLALAATGLTACSDDTADAPATGSRETYCRELRRAIEEDLTIFDPLEPATTDDTREAMDRLVAAAPAGVLDDTRLLAETFAAVTEILDELDPGDPEAATRLEELDIDQEGVADAQDAVSRYALDECQIDLEAINAASVTTTTVGGEAVPPTTLTPTTLPPISDPPVTDPPTTLPPTTG